ncbi:hypothetical protein PLESTB_001212800 [Pleodorina starrii]|uniref:Cyclic nucleotide-binding domain-containing protein n=1 Tax=Pleodorina starrii TaxID=330485 RepID=A0A9W6BSC6_9CHLO|nr:hypothetical protein PLESTM_001646200 [Pleodorina starrii]GLC57332.1 hypothetical protein PLESTB_001212800 [Pleodorina starrii]GLC71267.1 hypothetical protein PLESTF_001097000 [Pleodorina starrii]
MESVATAALRSVKSSAELNRRSGEGPPSAAGPAGQQAPPLRKKSTRISELLQEGAAKDKLSTLDAEMAASRRGSGQPPPPAPPLGRGGSGGPDLDGSLSGPTGAGASVSSRLGPGGGEGAVSGKGSTHWRKLNKAVVATKVLATRPNALSQGRQPARQLMAQQPQHKQQQQSNQQQQFGAARGGGGIGSDPDVPDFLLSPGQKLRRRVGAALGGAVELVATRMAIMPDTVWYQVWWFYYAVAIAIISCWVEPFQMAFQQPGLPTGSAMSAIEYIIIGTFLMDFLLKFFVAYFDPETGMLVTAQPRMALGYVTSIKFFLDILGCFPYDMLVSAVMKRSGGSNLVSGSIDWLKLLALSRAYRVFDLFHVLDYRMMLSQGTLMLLRNYIYIFFTAHWAACIFFHMAVEERVFGSAEGGEARDDSWVGRNADSFYGRPVYEQYILSLYFTVTIFTSMGDGRLFPFTVLELSVMIVYLLFNIFLGAYIIGTVTIMMVRADEHSKSFRESMGHLLEYSRENELPERLYKAMREHLEVHFDSAQAADDQVLAIYPTTIRRLALRHLYLQPVRNCYLFRGCKQRFLDALLTAARVELFLPGVEILTEGDNVVDLLVVMLGECLVSRAGQRIGGVYGTASVGGVSGALSGAGSVMAASGVGSEAAMGGVSFLGASVRVSEAGGGGGGGGGGGRGSFSGAGSGGRGAGGSEGGGGGAGSGGSLSVLDRSNTGGPPTPLLSPGGISLLSPASATAGVPRTVNLISPVKKGPSDALAEVAFFTDGASYETVVGRTPVRVLSLPKAAWELLVQQFPQQAKLVLDNVQRAAEAAVEDNLRQAAAAHQLTASQLQVALALVGGGGGSGGGGGGGFADSTDPILLAQTRDALTHHQLEMITRLDDVRTVAAGHTRKCDEMRTFEFLNTAAQGDLESLRTMLVQGISPNTADYDGRTGLMLAAAKGHDETVHLLLDAGADKDKTDAFGISALAEAVKNEHDSTIELMLKYGATLGAGGLTVAGIMCTAVFEGDLVKLRRLLRSGAPPDACDYDKRSALHIAGAEGNLAAVKLLVEEGGADPNFQDRWGNTALDEARRVGATPVVAYLESRQSRDVGVTAERKRQQAAHDFLSWCTAGEAGELRRAGGYGFGDEAGCAFAGLLVAASKGHTAVVEVLLEGMPPTIVHNHAHVAMLEAARMGHPDTVAAFRSAGVEIKNDPRVGGGGVNDPRVGGGANGANGGGGGSLLMRGLAADLRAAVQCGSGLVLEALLRAGVPGQREAGEGSSPLHLAVEHGHLGAVRRLVEHGGAAADLTSPDGLGRTPLQLAVRLTEMHPHNNSNPNTNKLHARAVAEYLHWATHKLLPPAAAAAAAAAGAGGGGGGGGGGCVLSSSQVAAAALERWGPIGHPAVDAHAADVVALIGKVPAASSTSGGASGVKGLMSPIPEGKAGERLTLSQSQCPGPEGSRKAVSSSGGAGGGGGGGGGREEPPGLLRPPGLAAPSPLLAPVPEELEAPRLLPDALDSITAAQSPEDEEDREGEDAPGDSSSSPASAAAVITAGSGGGGGAAAAAAAAAASTPVVDVWDNLPGTPGNSTRGDHRAAALLTALGSVGGVSVGGRGGSAGGGDPAEAVLLYSASVQHSAALLTEPPSQLAAASRCAAAAAGCISPVVHPAGGGGSGSGGGSAASASPLPGASSLARTNSTGLSSPRLILPPSGAAAAAAAAVTTAGGRSLAAAAPGSLSPLTYSRANSVSRSAASHLFGAVGPGGDAAATLPMAGDGGGAGGGVSAGQLSWRRPSAAAISPVEEDDIEPYFSAAAGSGGGGGGGGGAVGRGGGWLAGRGSRQDSQGSSTHSRPGG